MLHSKFGRLAVIGALLPVMGVPTAAQASRDWGHHGYSSHGSYASHRGPSSHSHWRYSHGGNGNHGAALGLGLLLGGATVWLATQPPPRQVVYVPPRPVVYASPPVMVVPPSPPAPVYTMPPPAVWYYCRDAGAYYPQVQTCRTPWETVPGQ